MLVTPTPMYHSLGCRLALLPLLTGDMGSVDADCAVIGVPDSHSGEAALALIVPAQDDLDPPRSRMFAAEHFAEFQQPQARELLVALPKTALGKIQRQKLRDSYRGCDATRALRTPMAGHR